MKQKGEKENNKGIVYSVPSGTCDVRYVGETGQHYCKRRNKHKHEVKNKKSTNAFYSHLRSNKEHRIDWEGCVYLDREKDWRRRKIKEAI